MFSHYSPFYDRKDPLLMSFELIESGRITTRFRVYKRVVECYNLLTGRYLLFTPCQKWP